MSAELDTIKRMNSIPMKKVSQRSVARMLKAGKPLAGLLVGLSSTLGAAAEREFPALGRPELDVGGWPRFWCRRSERKVPRLSSYSAGNHMNRLSMTTQRLRAINPAIVDDSLEGAGV